MHTQKLVASAHDEQSRREARKASLGTKASSKPVTVKQASLGTKVSSSLMLKTDKCKGQHEKLFHPLAGNETAARVHMFMRMCGVSARVCVSIARGRGLAARVIVCMHV